MKDLKEEIEIINSVGNFLLKYKIKSEVGTKIIVLPFD